MPHITLKLLTSNQNNHIAKLEELITIIILWYIRPPLDKNKFLINNCENLFGIWCLF